jgi:glycosyltransferase involved in cell wall biosynthesis
MYSPHAFEAFGADYYHVPKKFLFQFHPHFALENAILASDLEASRRRGVCFDGRWEGGAADVDAGRKRGDSAWQLADHVVCASSFTKRSLVEAGADASRITIIPYGVGSENASARPPARPDFDRFHVLFVGSGLQRKGLHHLILAWRRARLPSGSRLTVVTRVADPALRGLLTDTVGVSAIAGVGQNELDELYNTATLFAMPSLVEGFGQVYIEALSHGLPVLGTSNSCLPDIGNEDDGIFIAVAGDVDAITNQLEELACKLDGNLAIRQRAHACAAQFTWSRFRQRVRAVIHV